MRPAGSRYLLARRRRLEDAVGQTPGVLVSQQGRALHSAPLVWPPQEQDPELQNQQQAQRRHVLTGGPCNGARAYSLLKVCLLFFIEV